MCSRAQTENRECQADEGDRGDAYSWSGARGTPRDTVQRQCCSHQGARDQGRRGHRAAERYSLRAPAEARHYHPPACSRLPHILPCLTHDVQGT